MNTYTLDTGKKYIKDIFSPSSFYNIPDYQRPYVWEDLQVLNLLEDLSMAMERDVNKEYFLGCMIWDTKKFKENNFDLSCQDILDGQQRFITIYIIQAIIRDISTNQDIRDKIKARMRQKEDSIDKIPERNRIEFSIRDDRKFIDDFLIDQDSTLNKLELDLIIKRPDSSISVKNMGKAITSIQNWFMEKSQEISNHDNFQRYLYNFYSYISSKVLVLYLAVPDSLDDAHTLFTVLNSRGVKLKDSDILKAQNLRLIKDERKSKAYGLKWEEYENIILNSQYNSFDEFLWSLVYIKMKYRSDENQTLKKAFNFMYDRKLVDRGIKTFDLIDKYMEHLKFISGENIITQDNIVFSNLMQILDLTNTNLHLPCLVHYKECFGEYNIVDFLVKIDNIISAYWLVGNRNVQTRIFYILKKMDEVTKSSNNVKNNADKFLESNILKLHYKDEKMSSLTLNMNQFYDLLNSEKWGSFSGSKINKTRYLLLKMDLIMSNLNNRLYFNTNLLSVEHLLPQKIEGSEWNGITKEEHQEWLHKIGNIILIDRKKNSSLSNSIYSKKKLKYKDSIENRVNTNYLFMTYNDWDINNLNENHDRITTLLKDYYKGNSLKTFKNINKKTDL